MLLGRLAEDSDAPINITDYHRVDGKYGLLSDFRDYQVWSDPRREQVGRE